jgi:lipopolysaccharide biosynthesis glycosyltransferase
MSRLIYQVYVGQKSKLYDHCTQSVEDYAKRIGADYICQTTPILMIKPDPFTTGRSKEAVDRLGYLPIFEKENAFDYLNEYDEICIIDSDVYIRPETQANVFNQFWRGAVFSASIEAFMPITPQYKRKIIGYSEMQYGSIFPKLGISRTENGYPFANMGVMLFNKGVRDYMKANSAREFIQRPEFKPFVDGVGAFKWSTDQTLLNTWLRLDGVPWNHLDWRFNGLYGANINIKECHFVHFFLKDKLPNRGENVSELMKGI